MNAKKIVVVLLSLGISLGAFTAVASACEGRDTVGGFERHETRRFGRFERGEGRRMDRSQRRHERLGRW